MNACLIAEPASGLDPNVPTVLEDGRTVTAAEALVAGPASRPMYQHAGAIVGWLREQGAYCPDVVADYQAQGARPGGLMIRWGDPDGAQITTEQVAERFGPVPVWLTLRHDSRLDRRYIPR